MNDVGSKVFQAMKGKAMEAAMEDMTREEAKEDAPSAPEDVDAPHVKRSKSEEGGSSSRVGSAR